MIVRYFARRLGANSKSIQVHEPSSRMFRLHAYDGRREVGQAPEELVSLGSRERGRGRNSRQRA